MTLPVPQFDPQFLGMGQNQPHVSITSSSEFAIISEITRQVFSQQPEFTTQQYPESSDTYVVVEVAVHGSDEAIAALSDRWHREVAKRLPPTSDFSLSLRFV